MTLTDKQAEYQNMLQSDRRTIKVQIPNGPSLVCSNSWDYTSNLGQVTFKTTTRIKDSHSLLKVELMDLNPVSAVQVWKVRVLRQPESNLKDGTIQRGKYPKRG